MDSNKAPSRLYAAIFYPCMLAAVMLVGVMLFSPDGGIAASAPALRDAPTTTAAKAPAVSTVPAPEVTRLSLRWSASQLQGFLQEALDAAAPGLQLESLSLSENSRIAIRGKASRDALLALTQQRGAEEGALLRLALRFLPEELPVNACFAITGDEGSLKLSIESLSAGELNLPVTLIPEKVFEDFSSAANAALQQQGCSLERLFISENVLYLDCNFSKVS